MARQCFGHYGYNTRLLFDDKSTCYTKRMYNDQQPSPGYHPPFVPEPKNKKRRQQLVALIVGVLLVAGAAAIVIYQSATPALTNSNIEATPVPSSSAMQSPLVQGYVLDTSKQYGDTYENGVLPVGDSKYTTSGAKKGYVYACSQYVGSMVSGQAAAGASVRGPWFVHDDTKYDTGKKISVSGNVSWKGDFSNTVSGSVRRISTNDLPLNHTTGTFPITTTDPAYSYDRNPNSISAQSFTYSLNSNPQYGDPQCVGGQVGVMLTGVALFNAFDAGGRDAGAWEVQDHCSGHPEKQGSYHYHTLSECIKDVSVHTIIGYALDGFPITGPTVSTGNVLTTNDLDECHGITSMVMIGGKEKTTYHYVMTKDFPYSVSCFRATPIQPPGQAQGGAAQRMPPPHVDHL